MFLIVSEHYLKCYAYNLLNITTQLVFVSVIQLYFYDLIWLR